MNRILKRPMFRIGGSADGGITSGLRQGYAGDSAWDQFVGKIPEIREQAKTAAYQPRGTNVYDFMTEMGLDLVSRPRAGNIFQQLATSAKEPYQRFMERKETAREQEYASESDMFKTMLGSYGDILAAERGEGMAGKTEQWKMQQIPGLVNSIAEISAIPVEERTQAQKNKLQTDKISLGRLEKEDPFVGWFLQSDQSDKLFKKVKTELLERDQQSGELTYTGDEDPQLWEDTYVEFRKRVKRMGQAEGGRIGYQFGQSVTGNAVQAAPTAMPTAAPTQTMPEELGGISYEELRARLPQEVGDEIVRLLVNSAEALEDFATIQTEQDIANFNKKYGVNLVLPSEG